MSILEGKTVVVSGVGPGVGREIARVVLRDGGNAVVGARQHDRLNDIARELDPTGRHIRTCQADITDNAACERLVQTAVESFGSLNGVVHVAAYDSVMGGIEETSDDDWERVLSTNVHGTMRLTRAAVPALRASGGGSVVIIGSQQYAKPSAAVPQLAYGASKGALWSASLTLAQHLGKDRIRVNTVVPTYMWGPAVEGYVTRTSDEHGLDPAVLKSQIAGLMPLGEIPLDDDVAESVAFFLSDRSRMVTGQTLFVNGGEYYW